MKRKRSIWLLSVLAVILAIGLVITKELYDRAPANLPPEYAAYVKMLGDQNLRLPSREKLRKFADLWPDIPPERNAAFLYVESVSRKTLEFVPPGITASGEPYDGNAEALRDYISINSTALEAAMKASAMEECRFLPLDYASHNFAEMGVTYFLNTLAENIVIVNDAAFQAEVEGDLVKAVERYIACLRMGRHAESQYYVGGMLLAYTMEAAESAERLIANHDLPPEILRQITEVCATAEPDTEVYAKSILRTAPALAWAQSGVNWRAIRQDVRRYAWELGKSTAAKKQLAIDQKTLANMALIVQKPLYVSLDNDFAFNKMLLSGNPRVCFPSFRADDLREMLMVRGTYTARLQCLRVRVALELYRREHERYPTSLDALTPTFLTDIPLDPFTDQPLKFRGSETEWTLWSVGTDLTDNGGDEGKIEEDGYWTKDIVSKHPLETNAEFRSRPQE